MARNSLLAAVLGIALAATFPVRAETAGSSPQPVTATAKVTYLTSVSVYVDAGRDDGLREGDSLELLHDGQVTAALKVNYLSSHRAACSVTQSVVTPQVGDVVRFTPAPPPANAAATPADSSNAITVPAVAAATSPPRSKDRLRAAGIRGRVGVRYLWVDQGTGSDSRISQPALDLKLEGNRVGGGPFDFSVDARARRTSQTFVNGATQTSGENRLYRAFAAWNAGDSGLRMALGRQYSPSLATLNIFDGFAAELSGSRTSFGGMTGTQPDPVTFGYSSAIREHGLYFQFHNLPQEQRIWSFTTGLIGSYEQGEVNREFIYLQGQYAGTRISGYFAQEIDYNRGWKVDAGESTISPTSAVGNLRFRAGDHLDLYGGVDNRRSVRLYRDHVTPETEFDDSYRRGAWIGALTSFAGRYSVGADARTSGGGDAGTTNSYGLALRADRISRLNLSVRTRSTQYASDGMDGWLQSVGIGMTPGPRLHVELTGGVRAETHAQDPTGDDRLSWVGLDVDVGLGRHWYLLLSGESDAGSLVSTDQFYLSLTYRF